jgi:uncharacterized membrane protein YqiK
VRAQDGNGFIDVEELDVALNADVGSLPPSEYAYEWEVERRNQCASRIQNAFRRGKALRALLMSAEHAERVVRNAIRNRAAATIQRAQRRRRARAKLRMMIKWAKKEVKEVRKRRAQELVMRRRWEERERKHQEIKDRQAARRADTLTKLAAAEARKKRALGELTGLDDLRAFFKSSKSTVQQIFRTFDHGKPSNREQQSAIAIPLAA